MRIAVHLTDEEYDTRRDELHKIQRDAVLEAEAQYQADLLTDPEGWERVAGLNGPARGGEPGNVGDRLISYMFKWRDVDALNRLNRSLATIAQRISKLATELDDEYYSSRGG